MPAQVRIEAVTEQLLAALEAAEGLPAPQRLAVLAAVTQGLDAHWGLKQYVLVWMFVCLFPLAFCGWLLGLCRLWLANVHVFAWVWLI